MHLPFVISGTMTHSSLLVFLWLIYKYLSFLVLWLIVLCKLCFYCFFVSVTCFVSFGFTKGLQRLSHNSEGVRDESNLTVDLGMSHVFGFLVYGPYGQLMYLRKLFYLERRARLQLRHQFINILGWTVTLLLSYPLPVSCSLSCFQVPFTRCLTWVSLRKCYSLAGLKTTSSYCETSLACYIFLTSTG